MSKDVFGLYLILTNPVAGYEVCARAAVECGIRYLQLRMKDAERSEVLETAKIIREITAESETRFIVNDDLIVAMDADADGIHLGQGDMPLAAARQKWKNPRKIFGLSTHSLEQVRMAETLKPDYIGIGPVFATPTKKDTAPALGNEITGKIAQKTSLTSVAIGGVDFDSLSGVLRSGITNYCVVRAVNDSPDPAAAISRLQEIWKENVFWP